MAVTKSEEIQALDDFIAQWPAETSYLGAIFRSLRGAVVHAIRSDFCVADWDPRVLEARAAELRSGVAVLEAERCRLEALKAAAERDLAALRRQSSDLAENLDTLSHRARKLAG